MSEQKQSPSRPVSESAAPPEVPNRERRRLIGRSLAVVPVVMTLTSRPLWAQVTKNASNATGCRYITCMGQLALSLQSPVDPFGPDITFALTSPSGIRWREWDDDAVIFNPASGSTHRAPAAALDILSFLQRAPSSFAKLCNQLNSLAPGREPQVREWATMLLSQLEQAGLVERR